MAVWMSTYGQASYFCFSLFSFSFDFLFGGRGEITARNVHRLKLKKKKMLRMKQVIRGYPAWHSSISQWQAILLKVNVSFIFKTPLFFF